MSFAVQTTIVGVFANPAHAQEAIRELRRIGVRDDQIGMVSRFEEAKAGVHASPPAEGTLAAEGAAVGAATGAGVGALWALGIAAGALPAIGPVIAGGVLSAVLASAAGGAAAVGVLGALIGLGIPEDEARYYESEVRSGRTLITVRAAEMPAEVGEILRNHGGYDVHRQHGVDTRV
jgi:hypothetical protein